jgi:Mrp family chromosome partitioning ATPase
MRNIAAKISEKNHETSFEQKTSRIRMFKTQPEHVVPVKISRTLPPTKLLALLHAVEKNMKDIPVTPMILFTSPDKNAGADIVAFETAYAGALSGKRVLFIDTNGSASETIRKIRSKIPMPLNIPQEGDVESIAPFVNVHETSLFLATFDEYKEHHTFFPDSTAHGLIIDELREIFDLIVVYSESGLSNPLATIFSGLADASIIVAEQGRTRIPIIKDMHRLISMHGGHVAGVVLNKCRTHIPGFIYQAFFGV